MLKIFIVMEISAHPNYIINFITLFFILIYIGFRSSRMKENRIYISIAHIV